MRSNELLLLERRDLDFKHWVINLRAETTKSKKARQTIIDHGAERLINRLAEANPNWLSDKNCRLFSIARATRVNYFCAAVIDEEIEDLHFHDSRAEATTRLCQKYNVSDVAEMTGHADINFLNRVYYRKKVSDMAAQIRRKPSASPVYGVSRISPSGTPTNPRNPQLTKDESSVKDSLQVEESPRA
jgi:integrase